MALRVRDVRTGFREHRYRTPYKFGGTPVDRVTLLDVEIDVETPAGRMVTGSGSMPLGNVWSFPARDLPYETTLGAMKSLATKLKAIVAGCDEAAHPLELWHLLEPDFLAAARTESDRLGLQMPIPKLAVLVTASPFDAALHDACGKALERSSFLSLAPDLVGHDLSRYLGEEFRGVDLREVVRPGPADSVPLFHSVGGSDPLTAAEADAAAVPDDGLPRTLAEWISFNGLWNIKIKLQGESLDWDVDRTLSVDRIARQSRPETGWRYCVDFNEPLSRRGVRPRISEPGEGGLAALPGEHPLCRAADGPRPRCTAPQRHASGGQTPPRRDRRVAHRPGNAPPGA